MSYVVQEDGSPLRSLTAEDLQNAIEIASAAWLSSNCSAQPPVLTLESLGTVECGVPEFNTDGENANIWMFRDEGWTYDSATDPGAMIDANAVAFTTLTFNADTGELVDADVELNSENIELSRETTAGAFDLTTVVVHEMGHFLGFDHSKEPDSVMERNSVPGLAAHALSADDELGMCALYSEEHSGPSCEPHGGFSGQCGADQPPSPDEPDRSGCSLAPSRRQNEAPIIFLLLAFFVGAWRSRDSVSSEGQRNRERR